MSSTDTEVSTNLCLADKDGFFTSILASLTNSVTLQSSHLTDLVLLCTGPDGLLPISVHAAVLSSQSPLLRDLLLSATEPVLVLPDVAVNTVWYMLDLLYTGRCVLTKQKDRFKLVNLLVSMGLYTVAYTLEREALYGDHSPQEYLDQSISDRMSSSGSIKTKITPASPELDCKECGEKFHAKQAVELFFHERECKLRSACKLLLPMNVKDIINKYSKVDSSVPLSPSTESPNITPHSTTDYTGHFCQMCRKKVRNPYKLRDHYTSKHFYSEVRALIIDEKSYSCQICGKDFEGGNNMIYHMIRHVGVTHGKVLPFVERECGSNVISCEQCQICKENIDPSVSVLGTHLVEKHFRTKIENLVRSDKSECYICNIIVKSNNDLVIHVGNFHGRAMKWYKEIFENEAPSTQKQKKISKICHICGAVIAGAGRGWRFPLYAHFSRRHFAEELIRDFQTTDKKCYVCGKEEESKSSFVAHVGAKHRLVENYLNMNDIGHEISIDSPPPLEIKGDYLKLKQSKKRKQLKPRRLQLEVTGLARKLMDQADCETYLEISPTITKTPILKSEKRQLKRSRRNNNILAKPKHDANISCSFCEKKVTMNPVLQSHLFSKHFKKDCEEGIKQIFEKTGGVCPLCPGFKWNKPGILDWNVFIHFSRKHKMTEDLEYSNNLPNKDNVKKILQRFCPE